MAKTAHEEAQPEGAREVVSRALQGEAGACGDDQGCVGTALGRRCVHAEGASEGASTHRALLEVVVENVDVVEVVAVRASGRVRGRPAVRAAEATAATAAMMVAVTAAAVAVLAAVGGVGTREIRLRRGRWWVENVDGGDGGATVVAVMARWR